MNTPKTVLLLVIAAAMAVFFYLDGPNTLTLTTLKAQQAQLVAFRDAHTVQALALYGLVYVAVTALSLPGATILTLAGGALFGVFWGTLIVSFASTLGATGAFLAARFLFKERIQAQFGEQLQTINAGIAKDGAFYLFSVRLVPLFPFFAINVLMGLTPIKTSTFYWVSQLGMFAGTLVYVNAGTQLAQLDSLAGILSPPLAGALVLLGLLPLLAKKALHSLRQGQSNV